MRLHRATYPRHLVYKRADMIRIAVKARELTDIMRRVDLIG